MLGSANLGSIGIFTITSSNVVCYKILYTVSQITWMNVANLYDFYTLVCAYIVAKLYIGIFSI